MRQQPRGAAVPVGERMHPEQTVMQRRDRDDAVRARETLGRALVEALQPVRHLVGRGRDLATDLDMRRAQGAGDDLDPLGGIGAFDEPEHVRHAFVEASVDLDCEARWCRDHVERTGIDVALHADMCGRFALEIAAPRLRRQVGTQRLLDVDRAGVVPLYQVRAAAIHPAHEVARRIGRRACETACRGAGIRGEQEGKIPRARTSAMVLGGHQRQGCGTCVTDHSMTGFRIEPGA